LSRIEAATAVVLTDAKTVEPDFIGHHDLIHELIELFRRVDDCACERI